MVTRLDPPYRSHDQVSGCLIVPTCITCTACIENEIWCQEMSRGTSTAKKILLDRANCHRRYILYIIHILFYIKKQGTKSEPHVINIYRQINSTSSSSFSLLNTILIPLLFSISSLTFCCCGLVVHALPCYPSCSCRTAGCSFLDASVPSHAPSGDGYSSPVWWPWPPTHNSFALLLPPNSINYLYFVLIYITRSRDDKLVSLEQKRTYKIHLAQCCYIH